MGMLRTKLGDMRTRFTMIRSERQDSFIQIKFTANIRNPICVETECVKKVPILASTRVSPLSQNHTYYSLTDMVSRSSSLLPLPSRLTISFIAAFQRHLSDSAQCFWTKIDATYTSPEVRPPCVTEQQTAPAKAKRE
jgi:hypothetical protein